MPAITISDLLNDKFNANLGTPEGDTALDRSIETFGMGRGIVADKNGVLVAGNGTQAAAVRAGITKVVVVETDGDTVIVNKRKDLDLNSNDPSVRAKSRGLSLADNRVAQVRQRIDMQLARQQIVTCAILPSSCGYTHAEIMQPVQVDHAASSVMQSEPSERQPAEIPSRREQSAKEVPKIRQVVVNCEDETEQQTIYEMLVGLGIKPELRSL